MEMFGKNAELLLWESAVGAGQIMETARCVGTVHMGREEGGLRLAVFEWHCLLYARIRARHKPPGVTSL